MAKRQRAVRGLGTVGTEMIAAELRRRRAGLGRLRRALAETEAVAHRLRGEIGDRRPAAGEVDEVGRGVRHRGLLQHHLGEPHPIGVRTRARLRPPGQRPLIHSIPTQKSLGGIDGHGAAMPCSRPRWKSA